MLERRGKLRFLHEALPPLRVGHAVGGQDLKSDQPIETRIASLVDLAHSARAHSARAESGKNFVGAEFCTSSEGHGEEPSLDDEVLVRELMVRWPPTRNE